MFALYKKGFLMNVVKHMQYSLLTAGLMLLPGCDWFSQSKTASSAQAASVEMATVQESLQPMTGEVLVSLQGKPIVTTDSLEAEKNRVFELNPKLKMMNAFMDENQIKRSLAEGITSQAIISHYIEANKIYDNPQYKAEMQEGMKAIKRMIEAKYFAEDLVPSVSEAEIKEFYDAHKSAADGLLVSPGGVTAMGLQFNNEADAKAFAEKVKANKNAFQETAVQAGLADKIKDFKLIHERSYDIDAPIKEKVLTQKTFPFIDVIKVSPSLVWVVNATSKEDPKYRPLDERISMEIKSRIEKEKREKLFEEKINALKKEYNVVMNDAFFKEEQAEEGAELSLDELEQLSGQELMAEEPIAPDFEKQNAV